MSADVIYNDCAILEGDECPAAAWEEGEALCGPIACLEAVQWLLLTHVPHLQDACTTQVGDQSSRHAQALVADVR